MSIPDEPRAPAAGTGPGLPRPDQPFSRDHYNHRWPLAVEKVELWNGQAQFSGAFDERDVATARRCFQGRPVWLTEDGALVVGAASSS
jgi:hypothetical protein